MVSILNPWTLAGHLARFPAPRVRLRGWCRAGGTRLADVAGVIAVLTRRTGRWRGGRWMTRCVLEW